MATSSIRVLVVDDFEWFRRFVRATLEQRPDLQIICEVSDGVEAVQKAEEAATGLVLLDIGLPTLKGFEVTRISLACSSPKRRRQSVVLIGLQGQTHPRALRLR